MTTAEAPAAPTLEQRINDIVGRPLFWLVIVGLMATVPVIRALRHPVPPPPSLHLPLPAFSLTDQRGKSYGSEQLRGRVWVADFVFTSCPTVCPKLTAKMALIQHRARHLGDAFHLVTFTVDPENDTPARLASYATSYHADPSRWSFLTGALGDIETTVVKGFKIAMGKEPLGADGDAGPPTGLFSIFHGEKLVLVDAEGSIRGYYDADDAGIDDLLRDTDVIVNTR
jgi:protein SCO1/2